MCGGGGGSLGKLDVSGKKQSIHREVESWKGVDLLRKSKKLFEGGIKCAGISGRPVGPSLGP